MGRFSGECGSVQGSQIQSALWIALAAGPSLVFSFAFACATPFAGLATVVGTRLSRQDGVLAVLVAWSGNQAVGFPVHGYPRTPTTFAWGVVTGLSALVASLAAARGLVGLTRGPAIATVIAVLAAFIAYEGVLVAGMLVLPSGWGAFAPLVVARIFEINAVALSGLLLLHRVMLARAFVRQMWSSYRAKWGQMRDQEGPAIFDRLSRASLDPFVRSLEQLIAATRHCRFLHR